MFIAIVYYYVGFECTVLVFVYCAGVCVLCWCVRTVLHVVCVLAVLVCVYCAAWCVHCAGVCILCRCARTVLVCILCWCGYCASVCYRGLGVHVHVLSACYRERVELLNFSFNRTRMCSYCHYFHLFNNGIHSSKSYYQ